MKRSRLQFLSVFPAMRAVERPDALAAFATLMAFMTGHALLETARDALFLSRLQAAQLPWVYLAIALAALILTEIQQRYTRLGSGPRALRLWLMVCAAITAGFWVLVDQGVGVWVYYALYSWSGVLATLVAVRFWTLLGQVFTVTQAKRLFAFIGSGSVLGGILGSGLAGLLTEVMATQHIVLVAAGVFSGASLVPTLLERNWRTSPGLWEESPVRWTLQQVGRHIWTRPYLVRLTAIALVSTITFTLIDFVFKSIVDRTIPAGELAGFFASVYFLLNISSLLLQFFLVSRLVRYFGVTAAQACVPAVVLVGTLGFLAGGVLLTALLLKGLDGSLRHSLHRTTTELLFFPISDAVRRPVKAVIDVFGQRGGQAVGSLLILVGLGITERELLFAGMALATSAFWLWATLDLKSYYVELFRQNLEEDITSTQLQFPALDLASLETLISTLNDSDDRKVVAAMELLFQQGKTRLIPASILYHPSSEVVVRALELFSGAGQTGFMPLLNRLLTHSDPWVRATALRVLTGVAPKEEPLREGMKDKSALVRATATVGLVSTGRLSGKRAQQALRRFTESRSSGTRLAMARSIRRQPDPVFQDILLQLGKSKDSEVRLEVIRIMRSLHSGSFLPFLLNQLASRSHREEAARALVAHGSPALAILRENLLDNQVEPQLRRQLPAAIATFGNDEAAQILVQALKTETSGILHFKILRALGRMRRHNGTLPLDEGTLQQVIERTESAASQFLDWRRALEQGVLENAKFHTPVHDILVGILRDKQEHALERLFRLFNLLYRDEDFRNIYRGLQSARRDLRAGSSELLEHLVEASMREKLMLLITDLYDPAGEFPGAVGDAGSYANVLRLLLHSENEALSSLAAYHVGELGLSGLRESLLSLGLGLSPQHSEILKRSIFRLEGLADSG